MAIKGHLLTQRQKRVLCLVAHPNRQIADILGISQSTVARTLTDVYEHLDLGHVSRAKGCRRTAAVVKALRLGLVTLKEVSPGDLPAGRRVDE